MKAVSRPQSQLLKNIKNAIETIKQLRATLAPISIQEILEMRNEGHRDSLSQRASLLKT